MEAINNFLKRIFRNRNFKVRLLQLLNHFLVIYGLIYLDLNFLAVLICYFFMFCFGVNIGVHRYFSHRSFKTNRGVDYFLSVCFNLATIGSSLSWIGMHRQHHEHADTENDPHSPVTEPGILNTFKVYIGIWKPYKAKASYSKDIRRDKMHMFFHYYYFLVITLYCFIIFLFGGLESVISFYAFPAVLCFHAASLIVTGGHILGSKDVSVADESRNSIVVHWLTWGEGLHNWHHAKPGVANFYPKYVNKWYFFDLPGFIIETFLARQGGELHEQT